MKKPVIWSLIALLVGAVCGYTAGRVSRDEFVVLATTGLPVKMNKRTGESWQLIKGQWRVVGAYQPDYSSAPMAAAPAKPGALEDLLKATEPK
jgi:hypothetical protein